MKRICLGLLVYAGSGFAQRVTRPGSEMMQSNGDVNLDPEAWPRLAPGTLYLQFLRFIPQSGGWQPIDPYSALALAGDNWSWFFVRTDYKQAPTAGFPRASFESQIAQWLQLYSCFGS